MAIKFGKRCQKNENNPFGWQNVDAENIDFTKPIIWAISGTGTVTSKDANAMAKYVEQLLGKKYYDKVQVLSIYYDDMGYDKLNKIRRKCCSTENINDSNKNEYMEFVEDFYQKVFKKNIVDEQNKKKDVKKVAKDLRKNCNFFNFCFGNDVFRKIERCMIRDMLSAGYSLPDILMLNRQIGVVSLVPGAGKYKSAVSQIGFVSLDDYHYISEDAEKISEYYELDCFEKSYLGIVERNTGNKNSRMFYIDKLLDFNSIKDMQQVWLGRTEKLHQVDAYVNPDYKCEFGVKNQDAKILAEMIKVSLQKLANNAFKNSICSDVIGLDVHKFFKNTNLSLYEQRAKENGRKIDKILYPVTLMHKNEKNLMTSKTCYFSQFMPVK